MPWFAHACPRRLTNRSEVPSTLIDVKQVLQQVRNRSVEQHGGKSFLDILVFFSFGSTATNGATVANVSQIRQHPLDTLSCRRREKLHAPSTARSRASKGSGGKGAARTTFSFKDIRLQGARWRHLFLLGRIYQPASWRTVADVEPAVWLGYVARADYVAALDADGRPHHVPQDATVTPGSDRSWLSKAVRWTKLADLSLAWWEQHVEGAV